MILQANETLKDAVLSVNNENVNYPLTNILDSRLTRYFRTDDATTTATIVFDAGAAVTVDSVSIANHNISSGVTTLVFQGNATDAWGGPSVSETLTWSAGTITKQFTGGSYRYWRLNIIDAGNTDTYIKLGRVYASDSYTTPYIGVNVSDGYNTDTIKTRTPRGNTYGDIRPKYHTYSIKWPYMSVATDKPALISAFDTVDISKPFFVTFDESNIAIGTVYVTIDTTGLFFNYLINPKYVEAALSLIEEK